MTRSTSTKDNPTYDEMLGWPLDLNNIGGGPVVKTEDGQAWATRDGIICVFPDHWSSERADFKSVPSGTECVTLKGVRITA